MAELTIGTATAPADRSLRYHGATFKAVSGTGADATTVAAAVADKLHLVLAAHLTCDGADRVDLLSDTTVVDAVQFPARGSVDLGCGAQTAFGEALKIQKIGATTNLVGWIAYATLTAEQTADE